MLVLAFKVGDSVELQVPGREAPLRIQIARTCGSTCRLAFDVAPDVRINRVRDGGALAVEHVEPEQQRKARAVADAVARQHHSQLHAGHTGGAGGASRLPAMNITKALLDRLVELIDAEHEVRLATSMRAKGQKMPKGNWVHQAYMRRTKSIDDAERMLITIATRAERGTTVEDLGHDDRTAVADDSAKASA